jgi:hypothetical protein
LAKPVPKSIFEGVSTQLRRQGFIARSDRSEEREA